jgi:O-antigen ligase
VLAVALFALFSASESTIMQQNNLIWCLYVMTSAKLLLVREPQPPR